MKQNFSLFILTVLAFQSKAQSQINLTIDKDAPVVQTCEILINVPPEKVWSILTRVENWSKWNERISKTELNAHLAVGRSFVWKTNGSKINSTVHSHVPHKLLGWTGKAFGASAIHNWYLEPTKSGTKVRVAESMDGWIIKMMKKKMNQKLAGDMQFWLESLKIESEK